MAGKHFSLKIVLWVIICDALYAPANPKKEDASWTQPSSSLGNFGPVTGRVTNMSVCKGPKRKNCNDEDLSIETADQSAHRYRNTTFNMILRKPTLFSRMKMSIWRIKEDGLTLSHVSKVVESPCDHFLLGPLLKKHFKIPGSRCLAAKGRYVSSFNCDQVVAEMMGFRFFYGAYRSEVIVVSTDCNIYCMASSFVLEPKLEDKSKTEKTRNSERKNKN